MDNLLDQPNERQERFNQHISGRMLLFSLVFLIPFILGAFYLQDEALKNSLSLGLLLIFVLSTTLAVLGVFYGVRSYIKKEPSSLKRVWVLIGNLLVGAFLLSVIIANIVDVYQLQN